MFKKTFGFRKTNLDSTPLADSLLGNEDYQLQEDVEETQSEDGQQFDALARQQENEKAYKKRLMKQEAELLDQARNNRLREEQDRLLAEQLQRDMSEDTQTQNNASTVMVQVPRGKRGGQIIKCRFNELPHPFLVVIPPGLLPGDTFRIAVDRSAVAQQQQQQHIPTHTITLPPDYVPGTVLPVMLADGRVVQVKPPPNAFPGQQLVINPDDHPSSGAPPQRPAQQPPRQGEPARASSEREEFLAALPEDIRNELLAQEGPGQSTELYRGPSPDLPPRANDDDKVVSVRVPQEIDPSVGGEFVWQDTDGMQATVSVPPGIQPGEMIGVSKSELRMPAGAGSSPQGPTITTRPPAPAQQQSPVQPPSQQHPAPADHVTHPDDISFDLIGFADDHSPGQHNNAASSSSNNHVQNDSGNVSQVSSFDFLNK